MNSTAQVERNLETIELQIKIAQKEGVQLLQLPENFAQVPAHSSQQYIESENDGLVQNFLSEMSKQYQLEIIAGSLPIKVKGSDKPFARSLVYGIDGSLLASYDKIHLYDVDLPDGQIYRESETYAAGSTHSQNCLSITTSFAKLGLSICYDLRFPELYRNLAFQDAEILCVPSAFTYHTGKQHWQLLLQARAVENQAFVMAAAQVGLHENDRKTWGHSMIISPIGEVLAQLTTETGLLITEIDLVTVNKLRTDFPVLKHRRLSL